MGFFTVGNLLTLGIVALVLMLYRQFDRNNRTLKMLRDYSERLKKELNAFVEDRGKEINDYGISLKVEQESAKELMKRLQVTDGELAEKAAAVARIDSQIRAYENSLSELDKMTGRVQENMNRIRDESAFVETAGKRITEAKGRLEEVEKELAGLESRFERENAEALEKTAQAALAAMKATVSDLASAAETIERQVEDHQGAVNKIEQTRAASMARDMELVNKTLKHAVEQAGQRADKMEEAALVKLKEQAEDRIHRLKTAEEERLRSYQENAKARVAEVQNVIKTFREDWRAERSDWETRDKAYRDERKKDVQELNALLALSEKNFASAQAALDKRMEDLTARTENVVASQEALLLKAAEEMKQKALEITETKLEEYHRAQDAEFRRLETLAEDSKKLDAELRRKMQEVVNRVKDDFARYEEESAEGRRNQADKFAAAVGNLKEEMAGVEKELAALKTAAYENVSEKLKVFEDDFFADLSKRSGDIDRRLLEWREALETRLSQMEEEAAEERRNLEKEFGEATRKNLSGQEERLVSELERLKIKTGAFEEGIREQMNAADESLASFREHLDQGLEEARKGAELSIKSETGKHSLAAAEAIKQYQREMDGKLREMADHVESRSAELAGLIDVSRSDLEEARNGLSGKVRELDDTIEDARRRVRELAAETDNRIASVRSSVDDAERHIKEAVDQTKLLDRADQLKLDMERRIEDLRGDMDRLDQRRAEAAQLENDFVKIRRLEDDVNAKMTRFLSEKRRIETMETDFNRLLQISRSVEEKLAQVTASDDTLQGIQLQIRKLEEALGDAEDKYQRLERKSQILDNTNDGIDRNFKVLQESEKLSSRIGGDLERFAADLEAIKSSIENLSKESERAQEASEQIIVLDNALEEIEERIKSMQRAREWIAQAETRLEKLNKDAQVQAKFIDAMLKGKKGGAPAIGEGAPPLQKMESVRTLARQGWTKEAIAKTMKISLGEVELILETSPKD